MTLDEWQRALLPLLRRMSFNTSSVQDVTLLAYHFWDDERIDELFYRVECSFLCAFKCFGLMRSVLVVNKETPLIRRFCERFGVELQVERGLSGGLPAMNIDCNANLHRRFNTEYVLTIESDGMPVRSGLESFVGKWDYVGAPWQVVRQPWYLRVFPDYLVGNSGFCLRSKRICRYASVFYKMLFQWFPYNFLTIEDIFYCKTIRWLNPFARSKYAFPSPDEAAKFSIESGCQFAPLDPPMAFHGSAGFDEYVVRYGLPFRELLETTSCGETRV